MGIKKAQGGSISDCRSWIIKKAEAGSLSDGAISQRSKEARFASVAL